MNKNQQRKLASMCKELEKWSLPHERVVDNNVLVSVAFTAGVVGVQIVGYHSYLHSHAYTSSLSGITYRGLDAVRVSLNLTNAEAALLFALPCNRDRWLQRARRILRVHGYGKYKEFFQRIRKAIFK